MMDKSVSEKWNGIYSNNEFAFFPPCKVLHQHPHLLPETGTALDIACGMGRNAVTLARHGLQTTALDISDVAIGKLQDYAAAEQLTIEAEVCDLNDAHLGEQQYDVIVISHYLNRSIIEHIATALKPGGLLFYQTFTRVRVEEVGPSNPDYLLKPNELLHLFKRLQLVFYREEADIGDSGRGFRNEAMLIAQNT